MPVLPSYHQINSKEGIIFTSESEYDKAFFFYPIIVNWETLETTILSLQGKPEIRSSEDIEVFTFSDKLYIRLENSHYELNTSWKAGYTGMDKGRFEAYRALYAMAEEKRVVPKSEVAVNMYHKGLEAVLEDQKADFMIISEDGKSFPVHSFLLKKLWPFFAALSSIDMVEKQTGTLRLPYSHSRVQQLVDFFYGRAVNDLSWNSAVDLLSMSSVYDIPDLKQVASGYMLSHPQTLTFSEAMKTWKVAQESGCEDVKKLIPEMLKERIKDIESSKEAEEYTEEQLLQLVFQIVQCK